MAEEVVYNFAGLKAAALNPNIDTVYLGADIVIESGGINLQKNKPKLVIDGLYPNDGSGVIHTITDYNDLLQSDAIRVAAVAGGFELALKNCTVIGRNYYGIISTVLSSLNSGVVLNLENVNYSGPQAVYHRYGETRVKDGNFRIGRYNGTSATTNEAFETNSVVFSGAVSIYHDGTPDSCIWLTLSSPSFTLLENASVSVETTGRELIYNDSDSVNITLGKNSVLTMNTHWGMFYSSGMSAKSFVLEEGAQLIINQAVRNSGVATIQCSGNFSAGINSRLIIIRKFNAPEPLIQFTSTATAAFNNPKSVVLYNGGGRTINWSAGIGTLDITAGQINYWTLATALPGAGGFDDIPLYRWQKADGSNAWIRATLTSSSTTSVNTNIIQGTDAPVIPSTSTFSVQSARVLSFGNLSLTVDKVKELNESVSGNTEAYAAVRAVTGGIKTETQANSDGKFTALLNQPMRVGEQITVYANIDFKTVMTEVSADGILKFYQLPERLPFKQQALPIRRGIIERKDADWSVIVRDSRINGGEWYLYAKSTNPLSTGTAELDDALIMKSGQEISVLSEQPIKIFTGQGNQDEYTDTVIKWTTVEGLLLQLIAGQPYAAGHYQTDISFILSEEEI